MADFDRAFERMLLNEGGLVLHAVPGDRGGMTFGGIARKFHPSWGGWVIIDTAGANDPQLADLVKSFYRVNFWDRIGGNGLHSDVVAFSVFDFAVNAGVKTSVRLAQLAVNESADGIMGPQTQKALNTCDAELFEYRFALAKITRYAQIVTRDRSQGKFLLGWVNRTINGVQ